MGSLRNPRLALGGQGALVTLLFLQALASSTPHVAQKNVFVWLIAKRDGDLVGLVLSRHVEDTVY